MILKVDHQSPSIDFKEITLLFCVPHNKNIPSEHPKIYTLIA